MKIVMIGPFGMRPRGTMSFRALPLARALVIRGHEVTLLLPPWQNPEDAAQSWEDAGVWIENLPLPAGVPGWFHWRLTVTLARRALALQPDIIHVFKPKAYAGLSHWLLAYHPLMQPPSRHIPIVVDTDDWEGPGGWNDLNPYPTPLKRFFTWQEQWGFKHANVITVASRALETLAWATGTPPERVFYLPNGIAWPYPPVKPVPHTRPTLLLYTRFFEYKLERLWHIVQGVRVHYPDLRLWVVGKGFFNEELALLRLARESNWHVAETMPPPEGADLIYAGLVKPEERPMHFAQADIALYPFDDTLINRTKCPVKLLDLLAAGIPVVGDRVGQITESIQQGETGLLVPPGDTAAFTEAVLMLLKDANRRHTMSKRSATDVRARLSWDTLAATAEAAYYNARIA